MGPSTFTTKRKIKTTLFMGAFKIVLPTFDTCSDLLLIIKLYQKSYPTFATALLVPFLANYLCTWYNWLIYDKHKAQGSVVAVLLGVYPQAKALESIIFMWKDPEKACFYLLLGNSYTTIRSLTSLVFQSPLKLENLPFKTVHSVQLARDTSIS